MTHDIKPNDNSKVKKMCGTKRESPHQVQDNKLK
jgi:hypothetical protein